ncbi:MAG: tetratricopeptide repeat protein [Candidatus Marinimicrobia bacterium]|nr:tetratricopeptide repeat protein [Candidatus Neomarinimicrobiota bacterium]
MKKDRKLTAIMFIDMVGYTSMMQEDEEKTQIAIQHQRDIVLPIIESQGGKVLRYVGDGTLCTFESAIQAVIAAVEVQRSLLEDEINLRIGIHIGDIVSEDGDIYGDGVNVASRLEPLASPGGICVSETVYDNIKNQTGIECISIGRRNLKNVKRPMEVYALVGEGLSSPGIKRKYLQRPVIKKAFLSMAVIVIVIIIARFIFELNFSTSELIAEDNSLAVMFIENLMDPSDSERHAEMIKELVITDLSQSHDLHIIGSQRLYDIAKRNRKGEDRVINRENASEVAREAGARWMLVGKLSGFGSQMILTTQIEGVRDGKIVDSQRADSEDLFALVDMLTKEVKADLGLLSKPEEIDAPVKEITTNSAEAYQLYLEGLEFLNQENFSEAIESFQGAVEIDSNFTKALYKLAMAQWWFRANLDARETIKKILVNKESMAEGELLLVEGLEAIIYVDLSKAIDIYQRLLVTHPDDKEIHYVLGEAYFHSSEDERLNGLASLQEAVILDPEFTLAYHHIFDYYFRERMDDKAIRIANRLTISNPDNASGYLYLAEIYQLKGELNKSIKNYEKALERNKGIYESIELQGWIYRIGGKYKEALNEYEELSKPDVPAKWQFRGKFASSYVYAEQGHYKKAIQLTQEARKLGITIDERHFIRSMGRLAIYYSSIGDTVRAFSILDSALAMNPDIEREREIYAIKGNLYAGSGNQEELKKIIDTLNMPTKQIGVLTSSNVQNRLNMELFRLQGNIEMALIEFDKLWIRGRSQSLGIITIIYADALDWENVILTANDMQASYFWGNILDDFRYHNYPRAYYVKGNAYEEMGKLELAIENYEALLELWKDADEEIPERRDTIKRLAALKKES